MPRTSAARSILALLALSGAALITACSGGDASAPEATPEQAPESTVAAPAATAEPAATERPEGYSFPTGPAVLVAADYEPPEDHVASTGAYLPSNGKPTLVFVDAIW